jgi:hypothetical protein
MYLINFGLFRSPESTIDYLKVEKLGRNFNLGIRKRQILIMFYSNI